MRVMICAAVVATVGGVASAGTIEKACLKSDRDSASRQLCGCIQDVADLVLTNADQRRAASFFANPHKAQEVRQSSASRDEVFWLRYKSFGKQAQNYCG